MLAEVERITKEPVSEEDLANAKSYLIGNFPLQIETPNQIAGKVTTNKLLGRDKKHLETYRDRLDAVDRIEDVSRVMAKYIHPDNAYIVLVGDATEIQEKIVAAGVSVMSRCLTSPASHSISRSSQLTRLITSTIPRCWVATSRCTRSTFKRWRLAMPIPM